MGLRLENVEYVYSEGTVFEHYALKKINLEIKNGEFIGVIGHTGSGKSTLIQHLNGLIKPVRGNVYYNDVDIYSENFELKTLRQKVGLVFQYPEHQLFEADVISDVCFGPLNKGLTKEEAKEKSLAALRAVGLDEKYFNHSPFELSGGQKRRVAIAGILAMEPEILILDEPTAGLDPMGRLDILNMIKKLRDEKGISVVLVSHSMEDVADYVDRIIVMSKGEKVLDDVPKEVFKQYKFLESIGLKAPEISYIIRELQNSGININDNISTIDEAKNEILKYIRSNKKIND